MSTPNADGIYTAYLTGGAGNTFAMFVLRQGIIAGGDAAGGVYDGHYSLTDDGTSWVGAISFILPPGGSTITGRVASNEPIKIDVPIKLPLDFALDKVIRVETPTGPLNAKFALVRPL